MSADEAGRTLPGAAPVLGVVVVNYASSTLLEKNLVGVAPEHCEVIVVDNRSDEQERGRVRDLCAGQGWTLVEQPDNRGFGAGVNAGAAAARHLGCTSVLLLNPDVAVGPPSSTSCACRARPSRTSSSRRAWSTSPAGPSSTA